MNRKIIKNGLIGATVSSGASFLFFAFQGVRIRLPFAWVCAVLAAVGYGFLATKLSIYGKGSTVFYNWKNILLTLAIFVTALVACLKLDPFLGTSPETPTAVALGVLVAIGVSDALA